MQRELELLVYASVVATVAGFFYFTTFHAPVVITASSPLVAGAPAPPARTDIEELSPPPPTRTAATTEAERRSPLRFDDALARLGYIQEQRRIRTNDEDFTVPRIVRDRELFMELEVGNPGTPRVPNHEPLFKQRLILR